MNNYLLGRVAFNIFGIEIYWYGIFITLAIITALIISFVLCKRKGLSSNLPYEIIIAILPLGILCGRLFAVLFDSGLDITDYFRFRDGGMSIIGAVIGGAIGIVILCLIRKYNFLEIADVVCVVLILAQAIGRWGNFFNAELYGQEILNPSLQKFPIAVEIDGAFYEALFFYESMLNLIGFVGLICLYWFTKNKGLATGAYLMYYGIVRFFLEPRRQGQYILMLGKVQISRLMSGLMVAIGLGILIYVIVKIVLEKKKEREAKNG